MIKTTVRPKKQKNTSDKIEIKINGTNKILTAEIANLILSIDKLYGFIYFFKIVELKGFNIIEKPIFQLKPEFIKNIEVLFSLSKEEQEEDWFLNRYRNDISLFKGIFENKSTTVNDFNSISSVTSLFPSIFKLDIISIKRNSPIKIELLGIGEVVKELKEFILAIYDRVKGKKEREIKEGMMREDLTKQKLENIEKYLSICKEYGFNYDARASVMSELFKINNNVESLFDSGKIEKIEFTEKK